MKKEHIADPYIPGKDEYELITEIVKSFLLTRSVSMMDSMIAEEEQEIKRRMFRKKDGYVPKTALIELEEDKEAPNLDDDLTDYIPPQTVALWLYEGGELKELTDLNTNPKLKPQSGRYHYQASFSIRTDLKNGNVYYSYSLGPLFGRGFILDIARIGNSFYLCNERLQWIS